MNYIVYDLEWNQPTSRENGIFDPIYLDGEIIEIGAVKLDEAFRSVGEFKIYVLPRYYPKMHHAVSALTKISDKLLSEQGVPFPEAFRRFMDWCGPDCAFMSWSMSDLPILIDNLVIHGLDPGVLPPCCDVQRIFGREITRGQTRYSLETALAILQEKPEVAHDALNDARNSAKICNHLDLDRYVQEYISAVFPQKPEMAQYQTRQELLSEEMLRSFSCPFCGRKVDCEPWIPSVRSTYLAYGSCPQEDEFLLELTVEPRRGGTFGPRRLVFELSDDLWDIYMDRKELLEASSLS